MKDLPFDGKYPLYYLKWALFWTNWEYEEGKPIGKRYKKLSKMVKDREIAHLTPQPYAQETLLVALFSLASVLALPCPGSWKVFLLSPKANSFLSFKILDTFWLPHFPTPSLLPMSPQICGINLLGGTYHTTDITFWCVFSISLSAIWGNKPMKQ